MLGLYTSAYDSSMKPDESDKSIPLLLQRLRTCLQGSMGHTHKSNDLSSTAWSKILFRSSSNVHQDDNISEDMRGKLLLSRLALDLALNGRPERAKMLRNLISRLGELDSAGSMDGVLVLVASLAFSEPFESPSIVKVIEKRLDSAVWMSEDARSASGVKYTLLNKSIFEPPVSFGHAALSVAQQQDHESYFSLSNTVSNDVSRLAANLLWSSDRDRRSNLFGAMSNGRLNGAGGDLLQFPKLDAEKELLDRLGDHPHIERAERHKHKNHCSENVSHFATVQSSSVWVDDRIWDSTKLIPSTVGRRNLSEGGALVQEAVISWAEETQSMPTFEGKAFVQPHRSSITEELFCQNAVSIMCGLPSPRYDIDELSGVVRPSRDMRLPGRSCPSTYSIALFFASVGTSCRMLQCYVDTVCSNLDFYGHICTATALEIKKYLRSVHLALQRRFGKETCGQLSNTALKLKYSVLKLKSQLEYLVELCGINIDVAHKKGLDTAISMCPKGLEQVSRLYSAACKADGLQQESLSIAIFAAGTAPFIKFLCDWTFCGCAVDPYGEFGFKIDSKALSARDSVFWEAISGTSEAWPSFMGQSWETIANLGREHLLLCLYNPSHFLVSGVLHQPTFELNFSTTGLAAVRRNSMAYANAVSVNLHKEEKKRELQAEQRRSKIRMLKLSARERAQAADKDRKNATSLQAAQKSAARAKAVSVVEEGMRIHAESKANQKAIEDAEEFSRLEIVAERDRQIEEAAEALKIEMSLKHAAEESEHRSVNQLAEWRKKRAILKTARVAFLKNEEELVSKTLAQKAQLSTSKSSEVDTSPELEKNTPLDPDGLQTSTLDQDSTADISGDGLLEITNQANIRGDTQFAFPQDEGRSSPDASSLFNSKVAGLTQDVEAVPSLNSNVEVESNTLKDSNIPLSDIRTAIPANIDEVEAVKLQQHHIPKSNEQIGNRSLNGESLPNEAKVDVSIEDNLGSASPQSVPARSLMEDFELVCNEPSEMDLLTSYNLKNGSKSMYNVTFGTQSSRNLPCEITVRECILSPISIQARAVGTAVVNLFLRDLDLVEHLTVFRKYFWMGSGEWSRSLIKALSERIEAVRAMPMNRRMLLSTGLLADVLGDSREDADVYSQKLKLSCGSNGTTAVINPDSQDALDWICLEYDVGWPQNIVLDKAALSVNNQVFRLLLKIRRALWGLERIRSKLLTNNDSGTYDFVCSHQTAIMRHEMYNFANGMLQYMEYQLATCWSNLVVPLRERKEKAGLDDNTASLDKIIKSYKKILEQVLHRTLLTSHASPIMKVIERILEVILQFCALITYDSNWWIPEKFANVTKYHQKFLECVGFLVKVLEKQSEIGYQPHLEYFLKEVLAFYKKT